MTPDQEWAKVLAMFLDWRTHLNDGKRVDYILEVVNETAQAGTKCAHGNCTTRVCYGQKYCESCRAKAREYMRKRREVKLKEKEEKRRGKRAEYFHQQYLKRKAASV